MFNKHGQIIKRMYSSNQSIVLRFIVIAAFLHVHLVFSAPREVKVGALFMQGTHDFSSPLETKINEAAPLIAEAGRQNVDVVVLAETYFEGKTVASGAQNLNDSVVLDSMKVWAVKHNINIVAQVYELETNPTKLYNTAVLVNRNGEYIGKYRKVNLAPGTEANLLTPGDSYPVFDMDIGKVGVLICWDGWFTDPAKTLVDNGAEIILIPTSENDFRNMRTITAENGVPVAYSVDHRNDIPSGVFDHHGDSVFVNYEVGLNEIAIGTVTLGNYKNLALNKTVLASEGTDAENPASNAVDGLYSTERDAPDEKQTSWKAASLPQWIEIDLGKDYDIDRVSIAQFNTEEYEYQLEGRTADGAYELISTPFTNIETEIEWDIAGSEILSARFDKKQVRYVKLTVNSSSASDVTINEIKVFGYTDEQTGIKKNDMSAAKDFTLLQNYPNPFNPSTIVRYELPRTGHIEATIFDISGRKVISLDSGYRDAGIHTLSWDATDESGRRVASGLYLLRVRAGRHVKTVKMIYMR
ncbi:T9SS type A sorting domain-containing protein [candidate division KSB1 bacterium]|nr:T9SS type A sorting domain-containing protein [candidate division KSB1 bacterium]